MDMKLTLSGFMYMECLVRMHIHVLVHKTGQYVDAQIDDEFLYSGHSEMETV